MSHHRHPLRVLSISTLFPSPPRPAFGGFVARQMEAVYAIASENSDSESREKDMEVDLTMINPIGLPPWPLCRREPWAHLSSCPSISHLGALTVHHPRFTTIPLIGSNNNPQRLVQGLMPLIRSVHAKRPFELIDAQFFFPDGPAAAQIADALNLPLTIKARGADIHYWGSCPRALKQMLRAGKQAALQLSVCEALGKDMAALGLPADTIRIHHTGLNPAVFYVRPRQQARASLSKIAGLTLPDTVPWLICPGALIERKGQHLAMEALALLPQAHLFLVGKGPDEAALRQRGARSDLAGRVHFLGQIDHALLPVLMAACDALVLPSSSEGLANVWVEALACGTPLVIPDVGGAREIINSPIIGRLAEREGNAIAAALRDLLGAPPQQSDVAERVAHFSWQSNARKLVGFWYEAAQR